MTKKSVRNYRLGVSLFLLFVFGAMFLYIGLPTLNDETYENAAIVEATTTPAVLGRQATHVATPAAVKAIYMTSCVASVPTLRENLVKLIGETELDAVVIDIKSFDGHISFMPQSPDLKFAATGDCFVKDMQDFVDELHSHGIYVIGRLASFQDQLMVKRNPSIAVKEETSTSTIWRDYNGVAWVDPSSTDYRQYLIDIAKEAHAIGFDEINFDYIRFPADGDMKNIWYPLSGKKNKSQIILSFYEFIHDNMAPLGITTSGDLFGMTTTNPDDLGIGQILEYAMPNFDYVAPMVYPSHYSFNFEGLGDPNKNVYDVVKISMDTAVKRALATTTSEMLPGSRIGTSTPAIYSKPSWTAAKFRPWLQDNNYPVTYTPAMVRAQIQAAYDSGVNSWSLWNAGNKYTRSALEAATSSDSSATTTALTR